MSAPVLNTPPSPRSRTTLTVVVHGQLVEVRAELLPHRRVVGVASLGVVERDAGDAGARRRAPSAPARHSPDRLSALRLHRSRPYSVTSRYFQPRASAPRGPSERMQFRFDEDQLALQDAVRGFCADRFDLTAVAAREGQPPTAATWRALADLGCLRHARRRGRWRLGSGRRGRVVFEQLGAHLASGPVLWSDPGGVRSSTARRAASRRSSAVSEDDADGPIVVEHADECDVLVVLRAGRRRRSARDPSWHRFEDGEPLDPLTPVGRWPSVPARTRSSADAEAAAQLRRSGHGARARRCSSASPRAPSTSPARYALEREQFGVPIGSFQAIKHLLADMYVRADLARSATYAAAAIARRPGAGDPARPAAAAKLLAGEAGDRQRAGRGPGPRRHGLHLGHAAAPTSSSGRGSSSTSSAPPTSHARSLGSRARTGGRMTTVIDGVDRVEAATACCSIVLDRPERKNALDAAAIAADRRRARGSRDRRLAARDRAARHRRRLLLAAPTGWPPTPRRRRPTAHRQHPAAHAAAGAPADRAPRGGPAPRRLRGAGLGRRARVPDRARRRLHGRRGVEPVLGAVPRSAASAPTAGPPGCCPGSSAWPGPRSCCCSGASCPGARPPAWGLIHRAVPDDELDAAVDDARRRARRRGRRSPSGSPSAASTARSRARSPRRWRPRRTRSSWRRAPPTSRRASPPSRSAATRGSKAGERETAAMEFETILYEVDDRIATITFEPARPAQRAEPGDGRASCAQAYADAEADDDVWTLIVTGNGRAFCTGADVGEIPDDGRVIYEEPYLSTLRAVGGAAGGHAAVPDDDQADPHRGQRAVLRRRPRPGHHRRHRDRVRTGPSSSTRTSASAWCRAARWCGSPACCRPTSPCASRSPAATSA